MENRTETNGIGSVLLWIVTIALLIFTAARSVDLIQSTLPPDAQMLAYAALAGLDGGVLAWLFWVTRTARGPIQRAIGGLMIVVDLAGIAAAVLGDTMRIANVGSKELVGTVAVYIVPIIIFANVAATIVAHLADPEQQLRDARRTLQEEMERQKAEWIKANAPTLAAEVAMAQARHQAQQDMARFFAGTVSSNGKGKTFEAESDVVPAMGKAPRPRKGVS